MRQTTEQKHRHTAKENKQTNSVDCPQALERKELPFVPTVKIIALRTPLLVINTQRLREKNPSPDQRGRQKDDNSYRHSLLARLKKR